METNSHPEAAASTVKQGQYSPRKRKDTAPKVTITVDAISDKEFTGTITAISGATGSKYSLVPTDNSAGNFVKIQQRIPVRIDFTNLSKEDNEKLAAGMMVIVKAEL